MSTKESERRMGDPAVMAPTRGAIKDSPAVERALGRSKTYLLISWSLLFPEDDEFLDYLQSGAACRRTSVSLGLRPAQGRHGLPALSSRAHLAGRQPGGAGPAAGSGGARRCATRALSALSTANHASRSNSINDTQSRNPRFCKWWLIEGRYQWERSLRSSASPSSRSRSRASRTLLEDPETKALTTPQGVELAASTPEEFCSFMRSEVTRWARVAADRAGRACNLCSCTTNAFIVPAVYLAPAASAAQTPSEELTD